MTTDTGKHSALRQTSDGSFEIVYEGSGLHVVNEDEASSAELVSADAERVAAPPSRRTKIFVGVGGIALLLTIIVLAFLFSDAGRSARNGGEELTVVPGFKPYGGGGEPTARANRARPPRAGAVTPSIADSLEDEEIVEVDEAVAADEAGWEVQEEELPPEVIQEDVIEDEGIDEEAIEEEEGIEEIDEPDIADPRLLRAPRIAPQNLGRTIGVEPVGIDRVPRPNLPDIRNSKMYQERLNRLPIRRVETDEGYEGDEGVIEEEIAVEELSEEVVEEEEIIDEEGGVDEY